MASIVAFLAGCGDHAANGASSSSASGSATAMPSVTFHDSDLPVVEDFDVAARQAVTKENYRGALREIAAEIHGASPSESASSSPLASPSVSAAPSSSASSPKTAPSATSPNNH